MAHYTYENWRARGHRAMVHVGRCGCCKDGTGMSGGTRADNGKWHGPFDSVAAAQSAVQGIRAQVHRCV